MRARRPARPFSSGLRGALAAALALCVAAVAPPASSDAGPSDAGPSDAGPSDAGPSAAAPSGAVTAAALSADRAVTRLTLTVDAAPDPAGPRVFALDAPPRMVVDLPGAVWAAAAPEPAGLVAGVRAGLAAPGVARLVLDLAAPARLLSVGRGASGPAADPAGPGGHGAGRGGRAAASPPGGVVFVLAFGPEAADRFAAGAGWPAGAPRAGPPPAAGAPPPARRIVLDPGHGGIDPGAVRAGLREKDITLAFARMLAPMLEERGWTVALTREADEFVPLAARPALAQALSADAFLSIHADTVLKGEASGASVYVLSAEASDAEAAALADRENRVDRLGGLGLSAADADVALALAEMVRAPTRRRSQALGGALVEALASRVAVLASAPLRGAGFRVLKAPDVPSALIELGFLSSAADRARLADPIWHAEAAAAVADALDAWAVP